MDLQQEYNKVMTEGVHMALATSVESQPNVRVVTYGYDAAEEGALYFTTFKGNKKIQEFAQNPRVACLPLPTGPEAAAQVRVFGRVQKAAKSLEEMVALVAKKAPEDAETLRQGGPMLEVYELRFTEAWVTVGMAEAQRYTVGG